MEAISEVKELMQMLSCDFDYPVLRRENAGFAILVTGTRPSNVFHGNSMLSIVVAFEFYHWFAVFRYRE